MGSWALRAHRQGKRRERDAENKLVGNSPLRV
jgi:hypothetical protein